MSQTEDAKVHQSRKDITMVLLGINSEDKCMIGNAIVQEDCFGAENERRARLKKGDDQVIIFVINTPDKFHWPTPQSKDTREELNPSYPGPRVFLLVLQGDKLTQKEAELLHQLKARFGETMVENTIVVLLSDREESFNELYERADEKVKKVLDECRKRVCVHKKNQGINDTELIKQIMETWDQMQKRNQESTNTASGDDNMNETIDKKELMKHTDENKAENIWPSAGENITVLLLGKNNDDKCLIGNIILGEKQFKSEDCERNKKNIADRSVIVIKTPDSLHSDPAVHSMEEMKPSYTGSRIFLLVVQENEASQEEKITQLKERFGEKMVENTIVVLVSDREESFKEVYECADETLEKILSEFEKKVWVNKKNQSMKDPELTKMLMEIWDQMKMQDHESTNTAFGEDNLYENVDNTSLMKQTDENKGENVQAPSGQYMTVVLLGKNNKCKCLIGNIILEKEPFHLEIITCETNIGKVEDENVVIIKTPYPFNSDPMTDRIELLKPSYTGSHVFLLVLKENKASLKEIEMFTQLKLRFGEQMVENTIVLCNSELKLATSLKEITFKSNSHKQLLDECGNRVCFYNKQTTKAELVKHLMYHIKEMMKKNQASQSAQARTNSNISPLNIPEEPMQTQNVSVYQEPAAMTVIDSSFMTIVLLGQTGSGKSATGNTILGQQQFESRASSVPITKSCSIKEETICHIKIKVIDTPDFFNEDLKNQDEELRSCKDLIQHKPVVYLLVMHLGRFTDGEREVLPRLKKEFGEDVTLKTVIVFTGKEKLQDKTLADYINGSDQELQQLIRTCGSRCVAFDNNKKNHQQVKELMETIVKMHTDGNIPGMMPNQHNKKQIHIPQNIKDVKECRIL